MSPIGLANICHSECRHIRKRPSASVFARSSFELVSSALVYATRRKSTTPGLDHNKRLQHTMRKFQRLQKVLSHLKRPSTTLLAMPPVVFDVDTPAPTDGPPSFASTSAGAPSFFSSFGKLDLPGSSSSVPLSGTSGRSVGRKFHATVAKANGANSTHASTSPFQKQRHVVTRIEGKAKKDLPAARELPDVLAGCRAGAGSFAARRRARLI